MKTSIRAVFRSLILLTALLNFACSAPEKNPSAAQIPASMDCPASQDPNQGCPAPTVTNQAAGDALAAGSPDAPPNPKQVAASKPSRPGGVIEGRCEVLMPGDKKARPCENVKLMIRSTEKGELRDAEREGFGVKFTDLHQDAYKVIATSESHQFTYADKIYKPGDRVVIRLKAKPITR